MKELFNRFWLWITAKRLLTHLDPCDEDERVVFSLLRQYVGGRRLQRLDPVGYVKGLRELWITNGEHFPGPETYVLHARAIAWDVIKPCSEDIFRALELAVNYDDFARLGFPPDALVANLDKLAIGLNGAAIAAS